MAESRSKYGNKPEEYDGHRFDSRAEATRYRELILLQKAGEIKFLLVHPRYVVIRKSKHGRAITYEADFSFWEGDKEVAVDVKGVETGVFKLKARLFRENFPYIELRVEPAYG